MKHNNNKYSFWWIIIYIVASAVFSSKSIILCPKSYDFLSTDTTSSTPNSVLTFLILGPKQEHSSSIPKVDLLSELTVYYNHFRSYSSCSPSHHKLCESEATTAWTSSRFYYYINAKQEHLYQSEQLQHCSSRMGAGIWLLQAHHIQPYQVDVHDVSDLPTTFHHTVNCGVYTATGSLSHNRLWCNSPTSTSTNTSVTENQTT